MTSLGDRMTDARSDVSWNRRVLERLAAWDEHVRGAAARAERPDDEHRAFSPGVTPLAKFPAVEFDYLEELERLPAVDAGDRDRVVDEVTAFFRGAQRPESPYCLFNLNVQPTVDATAAACLSVMHNVNGLMDAFSGESLLVEQKVARTIGRWAGWPSAMGISCNGGKLTMYYALRSALSRAEPSSLRDGLRRRHVVLCSAGAHYSVEHVAAMVGIGASNCVRIPLAADGTMRADALEAAMEAAYADGAVVSAVVGCGGTVIDFCCDDTTAIGEVVDRFLGRHDDAPVPYLHLDGVIGWLYLAAAGLEDAPLEQDDEERAARSRFSEVLRRFSGLERFDSFGVDLHKTGLCPYSSSFFIARERRFMDELGTGDYHYSDDDFAFGRFRAYRYTVENTRPTHGVLAAWVNLVGLGREGYADYLRSLHRGRAGLEGAIRRHGAFTLLNASSLGWEVVVDIPFEGADEASYGTLAVQFMEHCWARVRAGHELPLFSIVPEFHQEHDPARSRFAFLIYPMRDRAPAFWDGVVQAIALELRRFEASRQRTQKPDVLSGWQKPIR